MTPTRSKPAPVPTRQWYHLRWTDVLALAGLIVFLLQAVDRLANGTPADPTLAGFSVAMATGTVLAPRLIETAIKRNGRR